MDRPDLFDETADPAVWSDTSVNDQRLTWKEAYEDAQVELRRLRRIAELVSDLDRCGHGRHHPDPCSYCQVEGFARNSGNTWLRHGQTVGTSLAGRPILIAMRPVTRLVEVATVEVSDG